MKRKIRFTYPHPETVKRETNPLAVDGWRRLGYWQQLERGTYDAPMAVPSAADRMRL
jgi:hypothetical protein